MNLIPTDLYEKNREKFTAYLELLIKWNKKINLTSIKEPEKIVELHFLDSLAVVPFLVSRETVLDIGSGGGFPGIPIKIVSPSLHVTLIDAVKKKCDFMKTVVRELGLSDITVVHKNLSEAEPIGKFNAIVSRATFKMERLLSLAALNLKLGGILLAFKGLDTEQELRQAQSAFDRHHFAPVKEEIYELPLSRRKRKILITGLI